MSRTLRSLAALAILAMLALIVAGCSNAPAETVTVIGSSGGNTTATGSSAGNSTPAQAIAIAPEPTETGIVIVAGSSGGDNTPATGEGRRREHRGALGEADGIVPDDTTVFDDEIPGVANLDPTLLGALRQAATAAEDEGVEFFVVSGWRSAKYQEQLLLQAVSEYGSEEEAARWVASPSRSAHVSGDAVDIGPSDAMAWLSEHGARYRLCQIYRNEPWHYELRAGATDQGCPPMYADPTQDPRMQP